MDGADLQLEHDLRVLESLASDAIAAWEREYGRVVRGRAFETYDGDGRLRPAGAWSFTLEPEGGAAPHTTAAWNLRMAIAAHFWRERDRARFESWLRLRPRDPKGGRPPAFRWGRTLSTHHGKRHDADDGAIIQRTIGRLSSAWGRGERLEMLTALVDVLAATIDPAELRGWRRGARGRAVQQVVDLQANGPRFGRLYKAVQRAVDKVKLTPPEVSSPDCL